MGRDDEARRLRIEEQLSIGQICQRLGAGKDTVQEWLRGVPVPEWTKRPNAKDDLRALAVELRLQGTSVPKIAVALGVARSTAFRWTQHIPLDFNEEAAERRKAHSKAMTDARWADYRVQRDEERDRVTTGAMRTVGGLSKREVLLLGAAIYWCEGEKSKPWRPNSNRVQFVNSDPVLVRLFIKFVQQLGYPREAQSYRIAIHESGDVERARAWWSDQLGVPASLLLRTTLKRHNPATVRHNSGDHYHGCVVVQVLKARQLYWRIEGIMRGMAKAVDRR